MRVRPDREVGDVAPAVRDFVAESGLGLLLVDLLDLATGVPGGQRHDRRDVHVDRQVAADSPARIRQLPLLLVGRPPVLGGDGASERLVDVRGDRVGWQVGRRGVGLRPDVVLEVSQIHACGLPCPSSRSVRGCERGRRSIPCRPQRGTPCSRRLAQSSLPLSLLRRAGFLYGRTWQPAA